MTYFSAKLNVHFFDLKPVIKISLLVIAFLFNMSDNNRLLWGDLFRELPSFQKQLTERYQLIEDAKKSGQTEVFVPLVKARPKLYIFGEEGAKATIYFVNDPKYLRETSDYFKIHVCIKE